MRRFIIRTIIFVMILGCTGCKRGTKEPYIAPPIPPGAFSISGSEYIKFAPGNLQYTRSTDTWSFAAHQYDFIGAANASGGKFAESMMGEITYYGTSPGDTMDLFGWSGSTATAQWGISVSSDYKDYSGDFADWGKAIGDGSTWRTLTREEWAYLLTTRTHAAQLAGVACILISDTTYANGVVLLPDKWVCPEGVTFKSGLFVNTGYIDVWSYGAQQTFSLSTWEKLETSGAVFLPAAGCRINSDVYNVQLYGSYWSATSPAPHFAYNVYFDPIVVASGAYNGRGTGLSVRLVQDL